jgi:hypothetical protein
VAKISASIFLVASSTLVLSACTPIPIGSPQPAFEVVQSVSASEMPASSVGTFSRGPALQDKDDRSLGVRAETTIPPQGHTFSEYLGELLKANLIAAGKLDPSSKTVISGLLERNELHAGSLDFNDAHITATFTVTRADKVIFHKTFDASSRWESAFLGAEAIPNAINQYTSLYKDLLRQLFLDQDFKTAIHQGASL